MFLFALQTAPCSRRRWSRRARCPWSCPWSATGAPRCTPRRATPTRGPSRGDYYLTLTLVLSAFELKSVHGGDLAMFVASLTPPRSTQVTSFLGCLQALSSELWMVRVCSRWVTTPMDSSTTWAADSSSVSRLWTVCGSDGVEVFVQGTVKCK